MANRPKGLTGPAATARSGSHTAQAGLVVRAWREPCAVHRPWHDCRCLATGLGAAVPTARASACYGGLAGQHESGGGSPGRWHDNGAERSAQCGDARRCPRQRRGQRRRR
jgi:hypothetical protein